MHSHGGWIGVLRDCFCLPVVSCKGKNAVLNILYFLRNIFFGSNRIKRRGLFLVLQCAVFLVQYGVFYYNMDFLSIIWSVLV
jgi:hypothetical protein